MRIGLCGAHRSGKTTLAKALAEKLNLTPALSQTSQIVFDHCFNMGRDNRLEVSNGFAMQKAILAALLDGQCGDNFIADRVPIDAAAYLLADATASAGNASLHEEVITYVEQATRDTFKRFDLLVLVPPAIAFVSEEGKPPFNRAYQFHHHMLCRSMLLERDEWLTTAIELPWEVTDPKERVNFVLAHVREAATNRKMRMALKTTEIFE